MGIREALALSILLDESQERIVLLDEPTANLHPRMQHKLLEILRDAPGQVIVSTHSVHVLPTVADEFRSVYRTHKHCGETSIMRMGHSSDLKPEKLEQELSASSDVLSLLFVDGVILVEGDTETAALNEWFPKSREGKTLADMNCALYSVGGKTDFPFYLRYLTAFGVPWVIICDGDAIHPKQDRNHQLWETLLQLNVIQDIPDDTLTFDDVKAQAEKAGVLTVNTSADEDFESIPDVQQYVANHDRDIPKKSKVRRGRYIAQIIPCPKEVDEVLERALKLLGK